MRIGVLRVILGIGIALNGAVLWDAANVFRTVETIGPPPVMPESFDKRTVDVIQRRCGAPIAKLYERCQSMGRASMDTVGVYMAAARRSSILQIAISGTNMALLTGLLMAFTRRNQAPSA